MLFMFPPDQVFISLPLLCNICSTLFNFVVTKHGYFWRTLCTKWRTTWWSPTGQVFNVNFDFIFFCLSAPVSTSVCRELFWCFKLVLLSKACTDGKIFVIRLKEKGFSGMKTWVGMFSRNVGYVVHHFLMAIVSKLYFRNYLFTSMLLSNDVSKPGFVQALATSNGYRSFLTLQGSWTWWILFQKSGYSVIVVLYMYVKAL